MTKCELINRLEREGLMVLCLRAGLIDVSIMGQRYIYEMWHEIRKEVKSNNEAYRQAAVECDCSERTVRRVIASFNQKVSK